MFESSFAGAIAGLMGVGVSFTGEQVVAKFGNVGVPNSGVASSKYTQAVRRLLTGTSGLSAAGVDRMLNDAIGAKAGDLQLQLVSLGKYQVVDTSEE